HKGPSFHSIKNSWIYCSQKHHTSTTLYNRVANALDIVPLLVRVAQSVPFQPPFPSQGLDVTVTNIFVVVVGSIAVGADVACIVLVLLISAISFSMLSKLDALLFILELRLSKSTALF